MQKYENSISTRLSQNQQSAVGKRMITLQRKNCILRGFCENPFTKLLFSVTI